MLLRVYCAGKLKDAQYWREIFRKSPTVHLHARWLAHVERETPDTPDEAQEFWLEDQEDVQAADALLVWADARDHLRGALVEVGMALAYEISVIVIGDHPDYGTWQHHPNVHWVATFTEAEELLESFGRRVK